MRTTSPLTERAVLAFLQDIHDREGRMPAILEVAKHFGHNSPTSIQRIYARLCEQRLLKKHGNKYGLSVKDLGGPRLIAQWIKDLAEEPSAGENELLERIRELEGVLVDLILIGEALKQGKSSGLDTLEVWTMAKSLIPLERIKARFDEIASR